MDIVKVDSSTQTTLPPLKNEMTLISEQLGFIVGFSIGSFIGLSFGIGVGVGIILF